VSVGDTSAPRREGSAGFFDPRPSTHKRGRKEDIVAGLSLARTRVTWLRDCNSKLIAAYAR